MKRRSMQHAALILAGTLVLSGNSIGALAVGTPVQRIDVPAMERLLIPTAVRAHEDRKQNILTEEEKALSENSPVMEASEPVEEGIDENAPLNILIADVNDYVNVRSLPGLDGTILGKLYDGCVGIVLDEVEGWCLISSGNVEGYVSAEYCITGEEAQALYAEVMQKIATVEADGLNVRSEPSTDSEVLKVLGNGSRVTVLEVQEDWVKVVCGTKEGYVSRDYVSVEMSYETAETLQEEKDRLAAEKKRKEEEARKKREAEEAAAREAAERAAAEQAVAGNTDSNGTTNTGSGGSGEFVITDDMTSYEKGVVVAEFALQFVGNPYVYGGTSLTNGADCSGFVLAVYKNFGVKLPHSANADRKEGYEVDGIANAQPGDLVCYSGHVGLYIGNGQIVHASTTKTGIKISDAGYKPVLAVRRIF